MDYQILEGPSAGVTGQIDFDADYVHVTPFMGLELPRQWRQWAMNPHVLIAVPQPRRGMQGHISGPGFDLHGDTDEPATVGLSATRRSPWVLASRISPRTSRSTSARC
jgi:hypothetical protein